MNRCKPQIRNDYTFWRAMRRSVPYGEIPAMFEPPRRMRARGYTLWFFRSNEFLGFRYSERLRMGEAFLARRPAEAYCFSDYGAAEAIAGDQSKFCVILYTAKPGGATSVVG